MMDKEEFKQQCSIEAMKTLLNNHCKRNGGSIKSEEIETLVLKASIIGSEMAKRY